MSKKALFILLASTMVLGSSASVFAQVERSQPVTPAGRDQNQGLTQVRDFQEIRRKRMEAIETRTMEMRSQVESIREERAEKDRVRQEEFKEKLQGIRDERRRVSAERLAENIDRLNRNLSSRYGGFLDAMELVLDKIEVRVAKIEESRGINLTETYIRIQDSRNLIERAREMVIEQATKSYIVTIESEETLRSDFSAVIRDLRNDHRVLRDQFISPLQNIIRDVMLTLRENVEVIGQDQEEEKKIEE